MNVTHRKFLILTTLTFCWNTVGAFPEEWEKKLGECTNGIKAIDEALKKGEVLINGSQKMDQCIRIISDINRHLTRSRVTERTENTQLTHSYATQDTENTSQTSNIHTGHSASWKKLIPEIQKAYNLYQDLKQNFLSASDKDYESISQLKHDDPNYVMNLNNFIQDTIKQFEEESNFFSKLLTEEDLVDSNFNTKQPLPYIASALGSFYEKLILFYIKFIMRDLFFMLEPCATLLNDPQSKKRALELLDIKKLYIENERKFLRKIIETQKNNQNLRIQEIAKHSKEQLLTFKEQIIPVVKETFELLKKSNQQEKDSNKCLHHAENSLKRVLEIEGRTESILQSLDELEPHLQKFTY
ncbi:hypothetical protein [Holospora curviuscula]|uniref:Uncharacterized protein n=1 Tax=Holospora curviuscula TaxID=1082868 RepID=A0A2S5RI19_9PROT|nr:hypothetical protein [Holospora curviuscula]PPE06969.1 hypothetical protein HCUR_00033 [Holospora curviuscula]